MPPHGGHDHGGACNHTATESEGKVTIHKAAFSNSYSRVRELVASGIDVNARDESQSTPMHWAAGNDDPKMLECVP